MLLKGDFNGSFLWASERSGQTILEIRNAPLNMDAAQVRSLHGPEIGYRKINFIDATKGHVYVEG
jgi:hypothetical protein